MKSVESFRLPCVALLIGWGLSLASATLLAEPWDFPNVPALPTEEAVGFQANAQDSESGLAIPEVPRFEESIPRVTEPEYSSAPQSPPPKPMGSPYKGLYFNNDFSYLQDPNYDDWHLGENFKQLPAGSCGILDIGGEYRMRQHHESGMRNGYTGLNDDFLLHRLRLYANYQVNDNLRFYGEMLHAVSEFERQNPRPIEENYWEAQNLFVDVRLAELASGDLWGRYGRQELLYGSQRAVSPLDWANTRRTFEGGMLFYKGERLDIDAFITRPMNVTRDRFDSPNQNQAFYGIYSTLRDTPLGTVEGYWLGYEDDIQQFQYQTFGSRVFGDAGWLSYELEGAYQLGDFQDNDHSAGAFSIGLGHNFDDLPWKPSVWAYYDWSSGDEVQGNGYHHLFPLGHRYWGWMDLFGRRNLEDLSFMLTMKPSEKWTLTAWHHIFYRQNSDDVPYDLVMRPFPGVTAEGSRYLGQEIDLMARYQISPRSDILFGYSHFFSGTYFRDQNAINPAVFAGDADFFYTQFSVAF